MATETSVSFGAFRLDPQNACVWRGTEMIKLTPKAFAVLHYLVSHPGRLVTKDELFTAVWPKTVVSDVALSVCVRELRKNLEDDAKTPLYIETAHRQGFRFIAEVQSPESKVQSQEEKQTAEGNQPEQETEAEKVSPPDAESPLQSSVLSPQSLDSPLPRPQSPTSTRLWPTKSLVVAGGIFLLGLIVIVQYLSQPSSLSTQSSLLRRRSLHCPYPTSPRLWFCRSPISVGTLAKSISAMGSRQKLPIPSRAWRVCS